MVTSTGKKGYELKLNVELQSFDENEAWPELSAYLYSRSGRLLARSKIEPGNKHGSGSARFKELSDTRGATVKIGPSVEAVKEIAQQKLSVQRLDNLPQVADIPTLILPKPIWICWIKLPYLVTGRLDKWEDGSKYPVCVGEVDIYDVDVRCLLKIPDIFIERIRDGIIDLVVDPPPFDIRKPEEFPAWCDADDDDWCGTPPGPRPPFAGELKAKIAKLPKAWSFAADRVNALDSARARMDLHMQSLPLAQKQQWLSATISEDVQLSKVVYSNTQQFRELLVSKFQSFRYWLCWYPWIHWLWWPWCRFYGLQKLGTAQLQSDGSFSAVIPLSICRKDKPDLWFKVRQTIEGSERVIYARYPVLCHTYWNHPSGDAVNLLTYDSEAVVCTPNDDTDKPGVYVMPLGIGDDGWYEIEQAHLKSGDIPNDDRGLFNATDPYGTRLDIRMQFHDDLISNGVTHYRWSVRAEGGTSWSYLNTPVTHRFLTQIGSDFYIVPEELGPFVIDGEPSLFKVPDPAKDWIALNRNDRAFAYWHTAIWDNTQRRYVPQVADGRYQLRLEMFDVSGNRLDPTAPGAGWNFFLPISDMVGGVWPVDDEPNVQSDGSVLFNLWVDNTDTTADIQSVGLTGSPTGDCQFIEYDDASTDQVRVTYVAYHKQPPERDFLASYGITIKRGISGTTVESHSSTIPAHSPANLDATVDHLLRQVGSKGPYNRCAFAVELHTNPRTRNGFSPIREYEDHDTSAFALMKRPEPCPPSGLTAASVSPEVRRELLNLLSE
jgi:hypothetical protein